MQIVKVLPLKSRLGAIICAPRYFCEVYNPDLIVPILANCYAKFYWLDLFRRIRVLVGVSFLTKGVSAFIFYS
jgi:hypothetical protein